MRHRALTIVLAAAKTSLPVVPGPHLDYELVLDCVHCGLCTASCPTYVETSNEADLRLFHAYAYGPAGDGWARDARWQIRVRDPFRVGDGIWSTAATPSAWPSAVLAADAFGRSPSGPPSTWRIVADPVKLTTSWQVR